LPYLKNAPFLPTKEGVVLCYNVSGLKRLNIMELPQSASVNKPIKTTRKKYGLNILIILVVAISFTAFTLLTDDNLSAVIEAFASANYWIILVIFFMMMFIFLLESTNLFILARLYTTRYNLPRAFNNYFIGVFFSHLTPSGTGGQFAQAYTFKRQGIEIASAASILVMHFLLSQIAQVIFGILALIFRFQKFLSITETIQFGSFRLPILYISLAGFFVNFLIIFGIILLAKWRFLHRVLINGVVGLLGKIKLLKHPDTIKNNLHIQIENFRIEIKRLQANTAVTTVLIGLFFLRLLVGNAIPYVAAMAIPTIDLSGTNIFDGIFMTAYLSVITYFAPLPGSVGVSEFFFSYLFQSIFGSYRQTIAPQLIWRGFTFYLTTLLGAMSLFAFRIGNKDVSFGKDSESFVEIQKSTIEIRRQTAEMMFTTGELSTVNLRNRFSRLARDFFGFKKKKVDRYGKVIHTDELNKRKDQPKKPGS
jgi:uncharacterized protein (TIRG00374 family)